eukprot:8126130-Pyramimonas_sp.AAC.1
MPTTPPWACPSWSTAAFALSPSTTSPRAEDTAGPTVVFQSTNTNTWREHFPRAHSRLLNFQRYFWRERFRNFEPQGRQPERRPPMVTLVTLVLSKLKRPCCAPGDSAARIRLILGMCHVDLVRVFKSVVYGSLGIR